MKFDNIIFVRLFKVLFGIDGKTAEEKSADSGNTPMAKLPMSIKLKSLGVVVAFAAIYFYIWLPALNIHDTLLYEMAFWMLLLYFVLIFVAGKYRSGKVSEYVGYMRKNVPVPFYITIVLVVLLLVGYVIGLPVLRPYAYADLIQVEDGDFASEVNELTWDQIPLLDADSANNLSNRKLGEISDLVSQFTVSTKSSQINFNESPVRVTYLDYGSFFKWWSNRGDGIPAYMIVDMTTQEVSVIRLSEGMKYSPSEYFNRDLNRHLRFSYPTFLYDYQDIGFEIDDEGTPYWVATVLDKTIGLFGGTDAVGAVLVNAITGETAYYDVADVPSWVDRVYSANLLVEQYNFYGKYLNGFVNSVFAQTDCTTTTAGYNYIALDDDVWMYTGITSVTGDRGNIGFVLVNQRTKETRYYPCAGAEEYSAASSAQGAVQQYSYTATFPLLLNIADQPTYFMALKDNAGLVKMYAMVNVQQYQIVSIGNTVAECQNNYAELMISNNIVKEEDVSEIDEQTAQRQEASEEKTPEEVVENVVVTGAITEIRSANIDGNTIFYLKLDQGDVYYTVSAKKYPIAAILNAGDAVTIEHLPAEGEVLVPAAVLTVN